MSTGLRLPNRPRLPDSHPRTPAELRIAFDSGPRTGSGGDPLGNTYQFDFGWDRGKVVTTQIDGLSYLSSNVAIDSAGFVITSTDPNDLISSYGYDSLGRTTSITPPGGEHPTRVIYPSLFETRVIRSTGTETTLDPGNPDQEYSERRFDGLGRVIETRQAMPDGTLTVQVTRYDQSGRVIFVSEPIEESAYNTATIEEWVNGDYSVFYPEHPDGGPWGTVTYYGTGEVGGNPLSVSPDPLGRVRKVVAIDGSTVETEYCGPHKQVTVHGIESKTGPVVAVTRYYHDGLGRLVVVDAPTGGADAAYAYDLNGNLVRVNLIENVQTLGDPFDAWKNDQIADGQIRTFVYDALG